MSTLNTLRIVHACATMLSQPVTTQKPADLIDLLDALRADQAEHDDEPTSYEDIALLALAEYGALLGSLRAAGLPADAYLARRAASRERALAP